MAFLTLGSRAHRRNHRNDVVADLVHESEEFLGGRANRLLSQLGQDAPGWSFVNALAHREPEVIARFRPKCAPSLWGTWKWAREVLASEVVDRAEGSPVGIRYLQQTSLVPLELILLTPQARLIPPSEAVWLGINLLRNATPEWSIRH